MLISIFYSNPPGGRAGCFYDSVGVRWHHDSAELFTFGKFCRETIAAFPPVNIWQIFYLLSFPSHDLTYSLTLNAFNVRQEMTEYQISRKEVSRLKDTYQIRWNELLKEEIFLKVKILTVYYVKWIIFTIINIEGRNVRIMEQHIRGRYSR